MSDGTQQRLGRKDNKPRIHIVYETEVGDAIEQRELPFVLGVLAHLAGDNKDQKPLHERDFVDINRDNFDEVMARLAPVARMAWRMPVIRSLACSTIRR